MSDCLSELNSKVERGGALEWEGESTGSSITRALETLRANADVISDQGGVRLTDPMFEHWLRTRGLTPAAGDDDYELGLQSLG